MHRRILHTGGRLSWFGPVLRLRNRKESPNLDSACLRPRPNCFTNCLQAADRTGSVDANVV
jgi:hypothetical protein